MGVCRTAGGVSVVSGSEMLVVFLAADSEDNPRKIFSKA